MRFKLDENLPRRLLLLLIDLGHDCSTVVEEGLGGAGDVRVASGAVDEDRILVTLDRGFGDIRANPPGSHPGIVVIHTSDQRPDNIVKLVQAFLSEHLIESFHRSTIIVEPGRVRVRRPPEH